MPLAMAHGATSNNSFSALAPTTSPYSEPGREISKSARKRRKQASKAASSIIDTDANVTIADDRATTPVEEASSVEHADQAISDGIIDSASLITAASANAKVLRLTNVDVAVEELATSGKPASRMMKHCSITLGQSKQNTPYSTVATTTQNPSSSPYTSPDGNSETPTNAIVDTNATRNSPTGPNTSKCSCEAKKSPTSTQASIDQDGWTVAPAVKKSGHKESRSRVTNNPPGSNPFAILKGTDATDPVALAKKIDKAQLQSHQERKAKKDAARAGPILKESFAISPDAAVTRLWTNVCSAPSEESPSTKTVPSSLRKLPHRGVDTKIQKVPTESDFPAVIPSSFPKNGMNLTGSFASAMQLPSSTRESTSREEFKTITAQPKASSRKSSAPKKSNPVVDQIVDDVLLMSRPHRQALLKGPHIIVYIGGKPIKNIAKRAAMAASLRLNEHFTKHPESLEYHLVSGAVDVGAVRILLVQWMDRIRTLFEAEPVPFQTTFEKDITLLHTARCLGMERYTQPILAYWIDYFKTSLPKYSEIELIERMTTSDKDPLWTSMVNHLCHLRHRNEIPDPEHFAAFLEKHPKLESAMASTDAYFREKAEVNRKVLEEEWRKAWEKREEEKKARWMRNQQERKERWERERTTAESLRAKQNGVQVITAEEAAMLRGR